MKDKFCYYSEIMLKKLTSIEESLSLCSPYRYYGRIISATGTIIIANLPLVKIGDLCMIEDKTIDLQLYAEVIAIEENLVKLLPFGTIQNISMAAIIYRISDNFMIAVNRGHLGKIINGFGKIIGNLALTDSDSNTQDLSISQNLPVMRMAPDPLSRSIIDDILYTGVRAIDQFITCGRGQRVAIFAGPGMGKTTLMGMIIKYAKADVFVVALVGERGREVREFIEIELTMEARQKCVLVVVTSDRPPVEQVKAAFIAQTIAEYFRDQGKNVVLFVDSITRFARAYREIGLSAGEPVTRGGFPPSVFLSFPRLMERAGNNELGSITAFYTVLMENDKTNLDPIADEVKSIIDGHIILDQSLVERGHFPAINILSSLSRVADRIIDTEHRNAARRIRLLLAKYKELEFLLRVGEYKRGSDELADEAIDKYSQIMEYLQQDVVESSDFDQDLSILIDLAQFSKPMQIPDFGSNQNIDDFNFDFNDDL